jgi:hypothetical protein
MGLNNMQQQPTNNGRLVPAENSLPMFGSMLVDEKSLTPYSDATQVSSVLFRFYLFLKFIQICLFLVSSSREMFFKIG